MMANSWRLVCLLVLLVLTMAIDAAAQTAPADPLETSWHVAVTGGYTNMSGQQTNNGALTSLAVRVAKHWNARLDYFAIASPKSAVIVAGPEYNFSLAHVLPQSSFFDRSKLEAFVNVRVGAGRSEPTTSPFKFAIATGGGLNYRINEMLIVRPLEVSYVRSAASGPQVIGNHMGFASGIGLRF